LGICKKRAEATLLKAIPEFPCSGIASY